MQLSIVRSGKASVEGEPRFEGHEGEELQRSIAGRGSSIGRSILGMLEEQFRGLSDGKQ